MEIYKNKTWNKLCAPNWREDENILTCKAMGYFENSFYNNARYKVHNASNATFCSSLTTCINTTKDELQLCKGICHIKIVNCIIFPSFSAAWPVCQSSQKPNTLVLVEIKIHTQLYACRSIQRSGTIITTKQPAKKHF